MILLLVAVAAGFLARPAEAGTLPFADIVDVAAERHGVDPDLVHAVIAVESGYRATAQAVFDGIPLRGGRRVVGHTHAQAVPVGEAVLQVELPGARRATVAVVGEDLQGVGVGIVLAALGAPPFLDAVDGERRGVGGLPDEDGAGVGPRVVDAVGDGEAFGIGAEVVVVDQLGAVVPLGAGIAERADELLLLRIDADDRDVVGGANARAVR